jgi:hypothetical protein
MAIGSCMRIQMRIMIECIHNCLVIVMWDRIMILCWTVIPL